MTFFEVLLVMAGIYFTVGDIIVDKIDRWFNNERKLEEKQLENARKERKRLENKKIAN